MSVTPANTQLASNSLSYNLVLVLVWTLCVVSSHGMFTYQNETRLFRDKFGPSSEYNPRVRPVLNQSHPVVVTVNFELIAIVEIDAVKQTFTTNGFMSLGWMDEILVWNSTDYGGIESLNPGPTQIWLPRLMMSNTVGDRDLFKDNICPLSVYLNGYTIWIPGSVFPASCKLNLYRFPFDVQYCYIEMISNELTHARVQFRFSKPVGIGYYVESGEWQINSLSFYADKKQAAFFRINFELKRRPGYFIMNIISPVVLMSFLNILVFIIPVDSGEKISYGITVLLALSVFMSIISSQLPRSSDTIPLVTIYLLVLTIISVCTVVVSILIVYFHHREEKEAKHLKAASSYKTGLRKIGAMKHAVNQFKMANRGDPVRSMYDLDNRSLSPDNTYRTRGVTTSLASLRAPSQAPSQNSLCGGSDVPVNRWRQIGRHLDTVSFVVFMLTWVSVTIGFMVEIFK